MLGANRSWLALLLLAFFTAAYRSPGDSQPPQSPGQNKSQQKKADQNTAAGKDVRTAKPAAPRSTSPGDELAAAILSVRPRSLKAAAGEADDPTWASLMDYAKQGLLPYHVLLATVPDPVDTNLGLYFDRAVDSIQSAAESSGYTFVRAWLPWRNDPQPASLEEVRALDEERLSRRPFPGALVFRSKDVKSDQRLVVFLVSESETSGIDAAAFQKAVAIHDAVDNKEKTISLAGPTFSGSFYSLRDALLGDRDARGQYPHCFHIVSGATTDGEHRNAFQSGTGLPRYAAGPRQGNWSFATVVHSDKVAQDAIIAHIREAVGTEQETLATISEDVTIFGAMQSSTTDNTLAFLFPRGISRLRNAYPDASAIASSAAERAAAQIRPSLPLLWKDERDGRREMPVFDAGHTPFSEQAVLDDIAATLNREKIKSILITATDPIDQLFLVRFFRDECPDARVMLLDSDLLFAYAGAESSWRGILSATTYPLMNRNQFSTLGKKYSQPQQRTVFASRYAEGEFNAVSVLLQNQSDGGSVRGLADYISPDPESPNRPPIWLTITGQDGYWPVAYIADPANPPDNTLLDWKPPQPPVAQEFEPPSRLWTLFYWALTLTLALYAILIFIAEFLPPSPVRWIAWFRFSLVTRERAGCVFCASVIGLSLAAAYAIYAFPLSVATVANPPWKSDVISPVVFGMLVFSALWPPFVALSNLPRKLSTITAILTNPYVWLWPVAVGLFGAFLIYGWKIVTQPLNHEGYFFAYRSLKLTSGVDPSIPLWFLAIGIAYWAWMQHRRLLTFAEPMPPLPVTAVSVLNEAQDKTNARLRQRIGSFHIHWNEYVPVIVLAVVTFGTLKPFKHPQTVEPRFYDQLYFMALMCLGILIYLAWSRIMFIWAALHRLLRNLERHPIREAFNRFPPEYAWFQRRARNSKFLLLARSLECMDAIRDQADPRLKNLLHLNASEWNDATETAASLFARGWVDSARREEMQNIIVRAANAIVKELQQHYWVHGHSDSYQLMRKDKPPEEATDDEKLELANNRTCILLEEFVALRYLSFIRAVIVQIRNLLIFVATGLVFAVISFSSYPFQSQKLFGWTALAAFGIFGAGIVWMFIQMDKDPLLSRISNTRAGHIEPSLFFRLAGVGGVPLVAMLASQFPSIGHFLFSWVEPALEAFK